MATEEPRSPLSPSSGGKHRRSPEDPAPEEEESPKRRKHHRRQHHHHHRRHRNHSKNGRAKEEEDEVDDPPLSMDAGAAEVASSVLVKVGDDEREEGEIVEEEEEEVGGCKGSGLVVGGCSDVESGEIGRDAANKDPTLVASRDGDIEDPKRDVAMLDIFQQSEDSAEKEVAWVKGEGSDRKSRDRRNRRSSLSDGENKDMINKSLHRRDEKGKRDRDVDASHPKTRARSRSPVSKESSHHKRNDIVHFREQARSIGNYREKSYERSLESHEDGGSRARKHGSEREDGDRHDSDRNLVRSRESERGAYRERERSSSFSRHDGRSGRHDSRERDRDRKSMDVDEVTRRERERSSSHSRYDRKESRHYSRERDSQGERRSSSARDRDSEKQRDRSRERYKERERGKSERERERDDRDRRERERTRSEHEREREIDDRDRNRDRDRDQSGQNGRDRVSSRDRHRDSRHSRYDDQERLRSKDMSREAYPSSQKLEEGKANSIREEEEEDYQEKIEQQLAKQEEEDVDKIKEESRKRRQAILEKYKQQQLQKQQPESLPSISEKEEKPSNVTDTTVANDGNANNQACCEELESKRDSSDVYVAEPSFAVGKSPTQNGAPANKMAVAVGLGQGSPKSERSADMFCDDIFGESPAGVLKTGKGDGLQIERSGLHDNWDDAEGYYSYRFGEVLDGRYEVIAAHGKGVFSTVVRAKDLKAGKGDPEEVAIKIIRNNETMYKAGLEELVILKKLAGADPEDKRHCVRFISSFKYRNHLCLVFESLHMNLREVLKKFGRNIGLKLTAVRAYGKQLFIALKHLRNCGVLHCDIKPDNMLVNEAKNVLKLCDFGNAMFAGKNEITPYLVSRFYRAPEIILGLPYDHPLDIWSVGCCLYELYSGKVLFPGPSNNDMLRLHMELKGPFPKKMLRKGAFTDQHFDQDLNFHATEEDPVTKKTVKRLLLNIKPKDIGALISTFPGEDPKMLASFKDLLERIFVLDPEKRMTVSQALSHPFITAVTLQHCGENMEEMIDLGTALHCSSYQLDVFCFLVYARALEQQTMF
ncbi:serine/threonine-protein kinase prpf4B isoform X2 [Ananas comosus]|uniref:Serine/threonine-protein kinase PRP4 homolog n=1 Tax=Ananas comosus TaxID=4615 RepID=A0A6P5F3C7_ANACO|nr:serine/threonine-protein kinase prpf4B isoform X2 [Ananas comosus]